MAKKSAPAKPKKEAATLAPVVMIYTKSSNHGYALIEAELIAIEGITCVRGIQVTGKEWHRMERKRTLVPFEHVASIVEFQFEEDLWKEPQPKHIRLPDEERQYTPLTSHTQPDQKPQGQHQGRPFRHGGGRNRHNNNNRGRHQHNDQRRFQPPNEFPTDEGK